MLYKYPWQKSTHGGRVDQADCCPTPDFRSIIHRLVLNRFRISVLTRPLPAFKAGTVGNGSLNIIGQQNMTALSSVKDLGLLRVNIYIQSER